MQLRNGVVEELKRCGQWYKFEEQDEEFLLFAESISGEFQRLKYLEDTRGVQGVAIRAEV